MQLTNVDAESLNAFERYLDFMSLKHYKNPTSAAFLYTTVLALLLLVLTFGVAAE